MSLRSPFSIRAAALLAYFALAGECVAAAASPPAFDLSRARASARTADSTGWHIRDLGVGLSATAIDQHGDVALAGCQFYIGSLDGSRGCADSAPSSYAYVYDHAQRRLIELGTLGRRTAVEQYVPYALNDHGQIVGSVMNVVGQTPITRPVIWARRGISDSRVTLLFDRPGYQGIAYGINERGVAVGTESHYGPKAKRIVQHAVRFSTGTPSILDSHAGDGVSGDQTYGSAYAINGSGAAAGSEYLVGVLFAGGLTLYPPFAPNSCSEQCFAYSVVAINEAGDVLGNYPGAFPVPGDAGFLWKTSTGALMTLTPPYFYGHQNGEYVTSLNDYDDFVGYAYPDYRYPTGCTSADVGPSGPWVSFVGCADPNLLLPANSGWRILSAIGINDNLQVIGQATYGGVARAYLLEFGS